MPRRFALGLVVAVLAALPSAAQGPASGVFIKSVAPLDEPRGLCIDIPGHRDRVNVEAPLGVHSCKRDIWHLDEMFDPAALAGGALRMPHYNLCAGVRANREGAKLVLGKCSGGPLQRWEFAEGRLRLAAHPGKCLTIGPGPSRLTPGGRRLPSRHVARSLALMKCNDAARDRQTWQLARPSP
jgi:hypothetical protein